MRKEFEEALQRAENLKELSVEELVVLISADEKESLALFQLADEIRSRFMGDEIHLRGIIECSNVCAKNCLYCGLRRDNASLVRYRMSPGEILESARLAADLGCRTIVLQSGENGIIPIESLAEIILKMKNELDVAITMSIGDRTKNDYAVLREAGADRYLLKHETCDSRLFSDLRPGTKLEERVMCMNLLRELGYQVGSGNMVGLPGQNVEILAKDILFMRRMKVEMAGIGPFIPNQQTPLGNSCGGNLELTLKTLAAARLALNDAHLPATTSTSTLHPLGRMKALQCGANVIMPNMTPTKYRVNYSLYPGKTGQADTPEESYAKAIKMVESVGRKVGKDYGHSPRYKFA